jgi:hypothetical protein
MDAAARLEVIEQLFFTDRRQAMEKLSDLVEGAQGNHRAETMRELVKRVDHEHSGLAAYLALAGGALVEDGEEAGALGRALVAPLVRTLVAAGRMLDHVAHLPDAEVDDEEDEDEEDEDDDGGDHHHANGNGHSHDHDHSHDHADADEEHIMIGTKAVDRATLDDIAERDLVAVQAWFSLDIWYRPAVATWTREPAVLRDAQRNAELRAAVTRLGSTSETSHWLSLLLETVYDARFTFLFPETNEAWTLTADGVVDMGQLSTLISVHLREPLARIGITEVADAEILDVMHGDGPQQTEGAYSCGFHCYPIEATDPETGMPRDEVHTWTAPGGTGTHSLPPDFLPGTLSQIDGSRVLLVVGPNSPGMRFVRVIPAVRTFDGLIARVSSATRLSPEETRRWTEIAKRHAVATKPIS